MTQDELQVGGGVDDVAEFEQRRSVRMTSRRNPGGDVDVRWVCEWTWRSAGGQRERYFTRRTSFCPGRMEYSTLSMSERIR